ncbi:MAG: site-specific integrase [Bacilli bacterium]|nr:site-specific integrase [Bacilli bacterium]
MAIYQDFKNEKDRENNKPIKTKDGRSWYFKTYKKDFNGINKAYKSKKYLRKSEAEEAERLFLMKRDNPIKKEFSLVVKEFFIEMYKIRKESTVYSYENDYNSNIKVYFENKYITDITVSNINDWKNSLDEKKYKLSYKNKLYNVLKCIFDFAMKYYGLPINPVSISGRFQEKNDDVIKNEEKIRYITYEQFKTFISTIDNITWKTFFTFLYYTGMRKGEVQALSWGDINFEENEIIVNKTLSIKIKNNNNQNYKLTSTKNNLNRKIKMSKVLKEQLLLYYNEVHKYTDFSKEWFVFGGPRFMPQITIDRKKDEYFKSANLEPITIHEFRHSHVSLLVNEYIKTSKDKNMEIDTAKFFLMVSNRMGHTVDVMQRTYLHLFPTIQDEIVDLLDNL